MFINDSTSQFISYIEKADSELQEIIEDEIETIEPKKLNRELEEANQEIEEIVVDTEKEIESVLEESSKTSGEKLNKVIKLLQEDSAVIQEKIKELAEVGEKGEKISDYLAKPLLGLSVGIHIAEKIESHLPAEIETLSLATEQGKIGLELVGLGFKCYAIQKKGDLIRAKIAEKDALTLQAQKVKDPKKIEQLDTQIEALDREIDLLKESFREEIAVVTKEFLSTAFKESSNVLEIVANSNLIDQHSTVMEKLLIASSDLSLAGSLVSLGWNCYQVAQHATHLSHTETKIEELKELSKKLSPDDIYTAYIVQTKLDRLANVKLDYQFTLGTKIVNMCASTLALAAATNTALIASGVAIGATASLALTVSGGTGVALAGGTVAAGIGVAAYQNRYAIEHAAKSIPIESQKFIVKTQLQMAEKTQKEIQKKLKQLEEAQVKNQKKLQALQDKPPPKGKRSSEIVTKMKENEIANRKAFQKMNETMAAMNITLDLEKECNAKIKSLRKELKNLETKKTVISDEKKMKNFRKKFRTYDLSTLSVIKKTIEEGLSLPETRAQIRAFLHSQNFPARQDFSVDTVLEYLTSSK